VELTRRGGGEGYIYLRFRWTLIGRGLKRGKIL